MCGRERTWGPAGEDAAVDVLVALAGAGGGAVSGVVMGATSYAVLALGGGVLAVALIPVAAWYSTPRRHVRPQGT